ncbi:MAG: hypothetical protein AAB407_03965 [Patescibacteria group bacterium]
MEQLRLLNSRKGQSLIEILIGITVGIIIIGSAVLVLTVTLRISQQNKYLQSATFLGQELLEGLTIYAQTKWYCVSAPCEGTGLNQGLYNLTEDEDYYLRKTAPTAPFIWRSGTESVTGSDGIVYTRFFQKQNVSRDPQDNIETTFNSLNEDPSTQRVIVTVSWPDGGQVQFSKYLTRHNNVVMRQTDWSGGNGVSVSYSATSSISVYDMAESDEIDHETTPGAVQILEP